MGNLTVVAYNKKRYKFFFLFFLGEKLSPPPFFVVVVAAVVFFRLCYSFPFLSTLLRPNAANESVLHNGSNTAPLLDAE